MKIQFTAHYASKFGKEGDCPLRRQVEFSPLELQNAEGFVDDPVGDGQAEIESGILQKYNGRILVLTTSACALNCRFCFRRNRKNEQIKNLPEKLERVLLQKNSTSSTPRNFISETDVNSRAAKKTINNSHPAFNANSKIKEVIFSGGDPLMLSNKYLQKFFDAVPVPIKIRIHSRVPIAKPERFTLELFSMLKKLGDRLIFVLHCNHPNELDIHSKRIFAKLVKNNATLLNQSVLLAKVNDNAKTLAELSEKLFSQKVIPYYLHQLDKAKGTAHFEVPTARAKKIFAELKTLLPGYLVPKLVKEVAGEKSKKWIL